MSVIVTKMSKDTFDASMDRRVLDRLEQAVFEDHNEHISIVYLFPVMYQGWECDDVAFLVQTKSGKLAAYGTDHGSIEQLDVADMKARVEKYRVALKLTNRAIRALERQENERKR